MRLSGCILTKNEEKNINNCITSILNICDEIILIDTNSTDNTIKIAENYTDKIFTMPFSNDFSTLRNYGMSKCIGDYILMIDGDESLNLDDGERLLDFLSLNPSIDGIYFKIHQQFQKGDPQEDISFRLFKNSPDYFYNRTPNEEILSSIIQSKPSPTFFASDFVIKHYGYDVSDAVNKERLLRNFDIIDSTPAEERDRYFFFTLGNEYMRINMYTEAVEAYETALSVQSSNQTLDHYIYTLILNLLKCYIKTSMFGRGADLFYQFRTKLEDCKDFCFMGLICLYECNSYVDCIHILDLLKIDGFSKTLYPCNNYYEKNNVESMERNIHSQIQIRR